MELYPDLVVNDRVRLTRPLKKGGMGSVWVGYHKTLQTQVAVKFMTGAEASGRKRFTREARAIAKIGSPFIVDVKDYGTLDDDTPYIVMELLKGPTLLNYLKKRKWMQFDAAVRLLEQLGRGLAAAHSHGVVHRDIKPDNIIVIDDDVPEEILIKLIDFGVAKETLGGDVELTGIGAMIGTPRYMSPEQIGGAHAVDLRADIWGAGTVMYRALTGQDAFVAETLHGLIRELYQGERTPASELRPALPKAVDEWFARTLCVEPERRFSDAREMVRAFRKAMRSQPGTAAEEEVTEPHHPAPSVQDDAQGANRKRDQHLGGDAATLAMDLKQLAAAMNADQGSASHQDAADDSEEGSDRVVSSAASAPASEDDARTSSSGDSGAAASADEAGLPLGGVQSPPRRAGETTERLAPSYAVGLRERVARGLAGKPREPQPTELLLPSQQPPGMLPDQDTAEWPLHSATDRPIGDTTTANSVTTSDVDAKKRGGMWLLFAGGAAAVAMLVGASWLLAEDVAAEDVAPMAPDRQVVAPRIGEGAEKAAEVVRRQLDGAEAAAGKPPQDGEKPPQEGKGDEQAAASASAAASSTPHVSSTRPKPTWPPSTPAVKVDPYDLEDE